MVRLSMLGPLELVIADEAPAATLLAQPKRMAVLAYLAAARPRGFHRRDHLMALFWPESDAKHARSALRQAIHVLNGALGKGALVTRGRHDIRVNPDRLQSDVWAFERAIEESRHREALELYRGAFLTGFHLTGTPDFDRWLEGRREGLRRAAVEAATAWGGDAVSGGRWEEAVEAYRRGLRMAPYDEAIVRGLLRALWGAGDRAGAIHEYEVLAQRLREDLELEPSTETEAVLSELRRSGLDSFVQRAAAPDRPESSGPTVDAVGTGAIHTEGVGSGEPRDAPRRWLLPALGAAAVVLAIGIGRFGRTVPESTVPRIAVLPMETLSPDPDDRYLAGGLHAEILTQLQRSDGVQVIGGTSVARYENSDLSLAEIADELEADLVAISSLRRDGTQVRVNAQLIDVRSRAQIWAETYDRPLTDVFAIQTDIARSIARALPVSLAAGETRGSAAPPVSLEAYTAFLEGLYHQRRSFGPEYSRRAVERFRRAVRLDPAFTAAWAHLVVARINLARDPSLWTERDSAQEALAQLEELAPSAPETRWARGIFLYRTGSYEEALVELEAARTASPGDADVLAYLGALHRALGRWEESREILLEALRLDPFHPSLVFEVGFAHRTTGRLEEATRYERLAVSLDPSVAFHWDELARASVWDGDLQGAHAVLDSATHHVGASAVALRRAIVMRLERRPEAALEYLLANPRDEASPGYWLSLAHAAHAAGSADLVRAYADTLRIVTERRSGSVNDQVWLAMAHAYLGDFEEALRVVEAVAPLGHALVRSQAQVDFAKIYVLIGRHDEAIDLLHHLLATPGDDLSVALLRLDPIWDPLREHPRFQALLEEYAR